MENMQNKLLTRQIKRHYGSTENLPEELLGLVRDIDNTYKNFEDDAQLLQNSIEISSTELREAFLRQKQDAEAQKKTINKIKEAIYALNPSDAAHTREGELSGSDSIYLFESLIKLIEERKVAEEALKSKTALLEAQMDATIDGILVVDDNHKRILINNRIFELFDAPYHILEDEDDSMLLKHVVGLTKDPGQFLEKVMYLYDHAGESSSDEFELKSGKVLDRYSAPVLGKDGKSYGRIWIFRDITVRKQTEAALQQSSKKWEAIIAASPDGIGMVTMDGKIQLMSDKLALMYGYSVEEKDRSIGKSIFDYIDPSNHQQLKENIAILLTGRDEHRITEYQAVKKDKTLFYVDVNSTVLLDSLGNPESILFVERDITDRKQAQEALLNERTLFRTIIDLIPDAVYVKDMEGRKLLANPTEVHLAGKNSEEEVIGNTDFNLYPDEEAIRAYEEDKYVLQSGNPVLDVDGTLIDKDGKLHRLLVSKVPLRDIRNRITGIVGITHDITERKKAEDDLKQASTRLGLATRAGGVGVWDYDIVNNILLWDDQMLALYGIQLRDFTGKYQAWLTCLDPGDVVQADLDIHMAIRGEKEFNTEFRVVWPDGSLHNVRALASVVRDDAGNPLRMIGTNWDITEQKNTETALIHAKQTADIANKAKSEFLANMSHEIRTPLNGVIGFTDLLQKTPLNKIQRQYVENVNTSGHSLLGIINDILDFSKIEAGKMELDLIKTDVIELAEQTSDIIKYHASQKGIELLLNLQPGIPRFAVVDPIRLKQILINLLGNAVKFTESGEVELKVSFTKTDEKSGDFTFSVRDTGIGITELQQKTLFKAFTQADSSTTRKFGGTGLGLTISNMLAEKMGTKIGITSKPGSGSTFSLTVATGYENGEKLHSGSLTEINRVLVIDDNFNNRLILEHTFRDWGIEFVGVESGESALALLQESSDFDVIIVDYHMPVLNGLDTIRLIREQFKLTPQKQPVILLHSSSDDLEIYDECKKLGVRFNLTKPVKSQELFHYLKNIHAQSAPDSREPEIISYTLPAARISGKSPVILIAEDVPLNMLLVTTIIRQMIPNVTIIEANSGKEAFDMACAINPDLILMDVQMPEVSGIDGTMLIRNNETGTTGHVPIIALTAGVIKGEKEKCLNAGMDDFLTKPIDKIALQKMLDKYLTDFYLRSTNSSEKTGAGAANLHFDVETLMNNIEQDREVLNELLEDIPIQFIADIARLRKAITGKDAAEIIKAAHSIKGAALNVNFNLLAGFAKEIEGNGHEYLDMNRVVAEMGASAASMESTTMGGYANQLLRMIREIEENAAVYLDKIHNAFSDLVVEWEVVGDIIKTMKRAD